ncbi:hypothetical protein [Loktanella sp. SALINAS62]|uniref:COG4315 family predicted lipoprotein n=1 Tax=Loktanella sp. SALINAS62 TaxID=2706124 RepID=UPI001B8D923B|nr:hypothetical protein [Loktanella sp. SALINAS62]MBS1303300.1 hypothetical protein [Loktanella sp. SALINAS62]
MKILIGTAAALAIAAPVLAQDALTIRVVQSDEYGQYLSDAQGRPVYLFTIDTPGRANEKEAQISCTSEECLEAWPLVRTSGDPQAGEGADSALLGTTRYEEQQVVTYNGWPLYYFARDESADQPQGNHVESFGGEWYLLTPDGEKLHE